MYGYMWWIYPILSCCFSSLMYCYHFAIFWYVTQPDDRYMNYNMNHLYLSKKSRSGDTLGPVELIVWPEQGNWGDWCEQDGQDEVSIIIFGMSKSSGFQKYSISWVFQALFLCLCLCRCLCHCLCLCICVFWWFLNSFHHKLSEYVWL